MEPRRSQPYPATDFFEIGTVRGALDKKTTYAPHVDRKNRVHFRLNNLHGSFVYSSPLRANAYHFIRVLTFSPGIE